MTSPHAIPRGKVDCFGKTDRGRVRGRNEDQFLIGGLARSMLVLHSSLTFEHLTRLHGGTQGYLLVVADGLGGHEHGGEASYLAVDALTHYVLNTMTWFFRLDGNGERVQLDELKRALQACNAALQERMAGNGHDELGTTLTMAYVLWPHLYVVHAGDSRCYLLRGTRLEQITTDHTLAQAMVASGNLPADEARDSRWSRVLWNALGGGSAEVLPDAYEAELELGDVLLLCSDGLTLHVGDEDIARHLAASRSAEEACSRLVNAANAAGGEDNVTVVVARFVDSAAPVATSAAQAARSIDDLELDRDLDPTLQAT